MPKSCGGDRRKFGSFLRISSAGTARSVFKESGAAVHCSANAWPCFSACAKGQRIACNIVLPFGVIAVTAPAFADDVSEQTFREWRRHQRTYVARTGRLAEYGYVRWIAAELGNVLNEPTEARRSGPECPDSLMRDAATHA